MTESILQQNCVKWWRYYASTKGIDPRFMISVPNGGKRDARTGALMKKEGAVAGVADLILFDPWGKQLPLFIEMKLKDTYQSDSQKQFEKLYTEAGYKYTLCRNFPDFENAVNTYLCG
jgi:hypothetical protein